MQSETISVIMPVKNMPVFIRSALQSIAQQAIRVDEILIVDDQSTDETPEVILEMRKELPQIRLIEGEGRGPAIARNRALDLAQGSVIAFLDADDLWPKDKLAHQMKRLCSSPEVHMVTGLIRYFEHQKDDACEPADESRTADVKFVHLGAALYRREVFEEIGKFDEEQMYGEDVDLMLRLREQGIPYAILNTPTLYYRRHSESMTTSLSDRETQDFRRTLRNSLRRRRSGAAKVAKLPPMELFVEEVGTP